MSFKMFAKIFSFRLCWSCCSVLTLSLYVCFKVLIFTDLILVIKKYEFSFYYYFEIVWLLISSKNQCSKITLFFNNSCTLFCLFFLNKNLSFLKSVWKIFGHRLLIFLRSLAQWIKKSRNFSENFSSILVKVPVPKGVRCFWFA